MIKIMTNVTTHTSKLIGKYGAMVQWRAGTNQAEIKQSCIDAKCQFLEGEQYMDHDTGEIVPKEWITISEGTITKEPEYMHNGRRLIKVDQCFSLFGTPMLSAFEIDKKFPERLGIAGLQKAIDDAPRNSDRARGALVGNASTIMTEEEMDQVDRTIRRTLKYHILYDHAWKDNPWILKYAVASCNSLRDVRTAINRGATQCSIVLPQSMINLYKGKKINGFKMLQCPENTTNGRITCSNCGGNKGPLCDAQERHDMVIMFNQHGGRSWKRKRKTLMTNIAKKAGVSLEEMERVIKENDHIAIVDIGRRAASKVKGRTIKKYKAFMELYE